MKTPDITPQQMDVIDSHADIKRVIACAGSGKTFVLTQSIIKLLEMKICRPDEILAVTFTRNAAENMRQVIKNKIGGDIDFEAINIYTFNSFGNLIISENSFMLGLGKNYRLINSSKSWQILFDIIKCADLKRIVVGKNPARFIEQVLDYIHRLKSNLISAEELRDYYVKKDDILASFKSKALRSEEQGIYEYLGDLIHIYKRYEEIKLQNNLVDYNDHVFLPYRLLQKNRSVLDRYKNRYRYIFIDEFQDTDIAQGRLVSLLFNPDFNSMMIVGDDDQGIYSFRGACIENILNFSNWDVFSCSYVRDYYLTTNFRSGSTIINTVNSIISRNENRFAKDFDPSDEAGNSEVLFFSEETHAAECEEITRNIKKLLQQGLKLKDIAILSRKKRFKTVCDALERKGLKYELVSRRGFFFEAEILFLVSWLTVLHNIDDEIYLVYLLKSEKYSISDRDIAFLKNYSVAKGENTPDKKKNRNTLIDGLIRADNNPFLNAVSKKRLKAFVSEFNYYVKQASYLRLPELIALIFRHSGLHDELKSDFDPYAKKKMKNIETMIKISADFDTEGIGSNLDSFITYLKDIARAEDEDPESIEFSQGNSLKIMSIHAAKGLEFRAVFLPMLWESDYMPRNRSSKLKVPALLRKDRLIYKDKSSFTGKKAFYEEIRKLNLEEERRIFYVACSRAMNYLFLSYSSFENAVDLKKPGKKVKKVLPFLVDVFENRDFKVLNKKSLDFVKNTISDVSGIHQYKYMETDNDSAGKDAGLKKPAIFDTDEAYRAERELVSILKRTGIKAPSKEHRSTIATEKITAKAAFLQERNTFSLTELLDYIDCPVHYKWKYFYNIPEKAPESVKTGESVHDLIRTLTTARFGSIVDNSLIDSRDYEKIFYCIRKKAEELSLSRYLDNYIRSELYEDGNIKLMFLEQLLYWDLSGHTLTCKLDRLDIKNDGSLRIIDYKISELKNKKPQENYIRQLKAYTAGVADVFKTSMDNIAGHLFFLGDSGLCRFNFNSAQIEGFRSEIKKVINYIKNLRFEHKNKKKKGGCSRKKCSYYMMCS